MEASDFKHGDKVTCTIKGKIVKDARISVHKDGRMYICQNIKSGSEPTEKFDYKYGWFIYNPKYSNSFQAQLNQDNIQVSDLKNLQGPKPEIIESQFSTKIVDFESSELIKKGVSRI